MDNPGKLPTRRESAATAIRKARATFNRLYARNEARRYVRNFQSFLYANVNLSRENA